MDPNNTFGGGQYGPQQQPPQQNINPQQPAGVQPQVPITPMPHHRSLVPVVVILAILLVLSLAFGGWAFVNYLDHKNNTDAKIKEAAAVAVEENTNKLNAEFEERQKRLHNTYKAPSIFADASLKYPRDWSQYLIENEGSTIELDTTFHPVVVRSKDSGEHAYALRMTLEKNQYGDLVEDFQNAVEDGEVKTKPIKKEGVNGIRLEGQIVKDHKGAMVMFPIRDKTLKVWTESNDYLDVFNEAVKSLSFTP